MTSLRLTAPDRQLLLAGAAALGSEIDAQKMNAFARFADVLDIWSSKVNLLSCRSGHELVERHFLDCLAVIPALPDVGSIVDLGSGAGFPGIPLALTRPWQTFVLVEARRRRVSFLREVRRTLGLENIEVVEGRAENPPEPLRERATAVMSRAAWSQTNYLSIARSWVEPQGRILWMRSESLPTGLAIEPLTRLPALRYRVGSAPPRVVEILASPGVPCWG